MANNYLQEIAEARAKSERERKLRLEIEEWLNSVPENIDELREGYELMRRLLNRAVRIELQATHTGKQKPILIAHWDSDEKLAHEKYWYFEAAENEGKGNSAYDLIDSAFESLEDLEAGIEDVED